MEPRPLLIRSLRHWKWGGQPSRDPQLPEPEAVIGASPPPLLQLSICCYQYNNNDLKQ